MMLVAFLPSLLIAALTITPWAANAAPSSACISMDAQWNLLAFNIAGKDYNAGPQDQWASADSPKELATEGRPPYTGQNVTCFLSKFSNAVYITGADSDHPHDIYIYDASEDSWSTQSVDAPDGFNPQSLVATLDHDTNVFYGLSDSQLYLLSIGDTLDKADPDTKTWQLVSQPPWITEDYEPVMGLALNHIHFLNVPDVPAGSATIFVIHYSYWQPEIEEFGEFPASHGQTASMFRNEGVQLEFAFIPDSGESTYITNVETNTTIQYAGPSVKDPWASYFGSPDSLVQLTSTGAVYYMPYSTQSDASGVSWSAVQSLAEVAPPSRASPNEQATNSGGTNGTTQDDSSTNAAVHLHQTVSILHGLGVAVMLLLFTSGGGMMVY